MRRAVALLLIAGFLTVGLAGATAQLPESRSTPEGPAGGRPMATADGLYWKDDFRLTNNPADDGYPTLVTDSFGFSHVMWYRSGGHYYKKIDRYGNELFTEKLVVQAPMPTQHCGQPTERIGIDGQECFHVVWTTNSLYGPMYQKFASNGNPLCSPINLAPMASMPHVVGLAVGKNNRAYLGYENEGSERIEMAYVDANFNLHTGYLSTTSGEGVTIGVDKKDKPHIFSKSWSSTGLFHTRFSAEAVLEVSPHRVESPVAGSGWNSPLPKLAFGWDGAIHMVQASSTAAVKTLYYTKLDNDGNKLTNDIVLSTTSFDYGDVCVDSKLNVYVIWGDSSDQELYYVQIKPNRENDTLTPVKLTQSPGDDRDPEIAVDPEDSLHVAWVSNRDGNREIYYKFAFSYGVELTMKPEEMAKIMYVHPNETKSANITVRNMGGQNDTMFLGISAQFYDKVGGIGKDYKGDGWKVYLDERYKEMEMEAQEVRNIQVFVRGPARGVANEYIMVTVNATSMMNPMKNDTVSFRVYLVVDHRILMKCPNPTQTTAAGVPTHYMIQVANIGDVEERVNLTTAGPPMWEYELDYTEVRLRPSENTMVTLTVTPPPDAVSDEVGIVTVTGRSVAEPSVKDTIATHTIVTPFMYIVITPDKSEDFVDPGNSTTYTLSVSNYGNVAGTVIIILEIVSGAGDWIASLDTNAVGVAGGETKQVVLTIVAPPDAVAGSRLVVRVNGFNPEKTVSADCVTTTIVKQVHNIRVASAPEMVAIYPGEKTTYQVTISNLGNGAEEVRLGASELPVGWSLTYERSDGTLISAVEGLYLEPGSGLTFNAILTTAVGSLAGVYELRGRILDKDGNTYPIIFGLTINQVFDIDITTTLSKQTGVPGKKVIYTIIGKNKGNGFDTLTFETTGLPRDWPQPEFRDVNYEKNNRMPLNATMMEKITLELLIPPGTNGSTVEFFVTAYSEGGVSDSLKLVVDIRMANLVISNIVYFPRSPKANKVVTVEVTVLNVGEVNVENVVVRFYEDKTILGNERLDRVAGGQNYTVTFTWLARAGPHNLRFVVDPDDLVVESNEADNIAKEKLTVGGAGWMEMPGFEAVLGLLALCVVASLALLRRRK
ncbi:MAG: CARDB domain-containing protein [Thermoplasmata archaeon]